MTLIADAQIVSRALAPRPLRTFTILLLTDLVLSIGVHIKQSPLGERNVLATTGEVAV
ncbi:hypothetical protein [Iodobacter fluviatilis]|uniref:hypothetical protein n=1 Tax=Iodobacter fluviatilis TaxID=537 RepID=UPI00165DA7A5|nr:hypothetical protein [Iodobacter fluviatilis]